MENTQKLNPIDREKLRREDEKLKKDVAEVDASLKTMEDFSSPEKLYEELVRSVKKYHPSTDLSMIEKAYKVASDAHKDQKRKSGEPYIIHPLCVGIILADLELDKESIAAGLLHDVVEDTVLTKEQVAELFGDEVALIVDGVTKLGQLSYSADKVEEQAENLRKMFLAMAKDIRSWSSWRTACITCGHCSICGLRSSWKRPERRSISSLPSRRDSVLRKSRMSWMTSL